MVTRRCHSSLSRRGVLTGMAATGATGATRLSGQERRIIGDPAVPMLTLVRADGEQVDLSRADIDALPWHEFATHTIWTEGLQEFRGPLLRDVLSPAAGEGIDLAPRRLRLTALNDFVVVMPASDAWLYDPILAREMNGAEMRVRDKGPLWLVYPRDTTPALQDPLFDERWIWQLRRIEIL